MQDTLELVPLLQGLTNQTLGPPLLDRETFNSFSSSILSAFPYLSSIAYGSILLPSQIPSWPCKVEPIGEDFFPNQSLYIVTTYLAQGLQNFECIDLYSQSDRDQWDALASLSNPFASVINFNNARQEFSHFIPILVPGSRNAVDPRLGGATISLISPLPLVFEALSTNPSIYVQVFREKKDSSNQEEQEIFATTPVLTGPSHFQTCRHVPLKLPLGEKLDEWTLCFQGSEEIFRNGEERDLLVVTSVLISLVAVIGILFGIYSERTSYKKAEVAGTSQRQVASWICHDMRAPLARLSQQAGLGPVSRADTQKEVGKMQAVIRNFLDIDRIMMGSFPERTESFETEGWLRDFLGALLPSAPLTLRVKLGRSLPLRLALDKGRIEQILTNILHNAAKHSTNHHATLFLTLDEGHRLCGRVSNPSAVTHFVPDRLYKPPPNYKLLKKIFADEPPPVLQAFDRLGEKGVELTLDEKMEIVSRHEESSVGWGLTIVKMLVIGMGGDFFISYDPVSLMTAARFYVPLKKEVSLEVTSTPN